MSSSNSKNLCGNDLLALCLRSWYASPESHKTYSWDITKTEDGKCNVNVMIGNPNDGFKHMGIIIPPCYTVAIEDGHFTKPQNITCPRITTTAEVQAARQRAIDAAKIYGIIFATLLLIRLFSYLFCKKRAFHKAPVKKLALITKKAAGPCCKPRAPRTSPD